MYKCFLWLTVHLGACAMGEGGRPASPVGTTDCCLQTGAIHPHSGSLCVELPYDIWKHGHCGKETMTIKQLKFLVVIKVQFTEPSWQRWIIHVNIYTQSPSIKI